MLTREQILDKVKHCTVQLGAEFEYPDLYGKYGYTRGDIYTGWEWFTEETITDIARKNGYLPLIEATDNELLMMLAIANEYWLNRYKKE